MNKPFSIIVAMDQDRGIAKNGKMPWSIPGDLKHFKNITTTTQDPLKCNALIMGRKTWESIDPSKQPLEQRLNIVVTKDEQYPLPKDVLRAKSIDEAFRLTEENSDACCVESIFVIGGQAVFEQTITSKDCQNIYVTQIMQSYDCDTFFPSINNSFEHKGSSPVENENTTSYVFEHYQRK